MATYEVNGKMTYLDKNKDKYIVYPKTKLDETLTVSGIPADSKAVGNAIGNLRTELSADYTEKIAAADGAIRGDVNSVKIELQGAISTGDDAVRGEFAAADEVLGDSLEGTIRLHVDALMERIAALSNKLNATNAAVTQLRNKIADIEARVQALEGGSTSAPLYTIETVSTSNTDASIRVTDTETSSSETILYSTVLGQGPENGKSYDYFTLWFLEANSWRITSKIDELIVGNETLNNGNTFSWQFTESVSLSIALPISTGSAS